MLLLIPVEGYLEGLTGRGHSETEWVDVSMSYLKGRLAGLPLQILDDRKEEILAGWRRHLGGHCQRAIGSSLKGTVGSPETLNGLRVPTLIAGGCAVCSKFGRARHTRRLTRRIA